MQGSKITENKDHFIKTNLTLPISKPEYINVKNSINSNNSFELKKVTKTKNIRNNNEGNNNQIVLKTPKKPKFIQDRWEIVLKFRKEFQNK